MVVLCRNFDFPLWRKSALNVICFGATAWTSRWYFPPISVFWYCWSLNRDCGSDWPVYFEMRRGLIILPFGLGKLWLYPDKWLWRLGECGPSGRRDYSTLAPTQILRSDWSAKRLWLVALDDLWTFVSTDRSPSSSRVCGARCSPAAEQHCLSTMTTAI